MPEPKRPLKVFLCHAHADRDPVRALYSRLTKDGVDAWLDKAKLLPGQDWELEIRKAVREADVVVVCLSKQFNQAGFRQKEVRLALDTAMEKPEGEIFIIPARLEECDTLESLRKWHWVDLFENNGYEKLTRALVTRSKEVDARLPFKNNRTAEAFLEVIAAPTLKDSLILLVDSINVVLNVPVIVNSPQNIFLPLWKKHILLEIVREALLNAIIHTGALNNTDIKIFIDVTVSQNGKELELSVIDTGIGFDKVHDGTGFVKMKLFEKASNLDKGNSSLSITSQPGKGVKVTLKMIFSQNILVPE